MKKITEQVVESLKRIVGVADISMREKELATHSRDKSFHPAVMPDMVVWPESTLEVSKIVRLANKHRIPVTAWGGGSSLEGNPIPVRGGIVIDMSKMNAIVRVYPEDLEVRVQSGMIGDILNNELRKKYSLFFPAAPGSSNVATIGGMIANNAGGMYAVKYGVVGDWVLELEVVMADGTIVRTGSRSFKSVSGYDLTSLFTGSEGTLGIITEATVKLAPLPMTTFVCMVAFPTVTHAVSLALDLLTSDMKPAAVEFMDASYMVLVNQAKHTDLPEKPTLIIELGGDKEVIAYQIKMIKSLCKKNRAVFYQEYKTAKQQKTLWENRWAVRPMIRKLLPGSGVLSAEVGLPLSKVQAFLKKTDELSQKNGIQTIMFGHIGDGNFHGWAIYELDNKKSWGEVSRLNSALITYAVKAGGTVTGEHGIGIGKRKFLPLEHPTGYPLMKSIKKLFDPAGILNPGKIFLD